MKTVQITGKGKVTTIDIPMPELKPGHVLLKTAYVGFCGSDLNTFRNLNPLAKLPLIPGHEIGAKIEAVGEGVPSTLKSGMNATINPYTSCGTCSACKNNRPNACEFNQTMGVQKDGGMTEYLVVPWEKVIADPDISLRDFALVEPMSVGFHAVNRAMVSKTDTVMVIGCGMIGLGAIVAAALRGAVVIAVDVDNHKLELAKGLGASYAINSLTEDLHERNKALTNNHGADVIIEAVGRPETYTAAVMEVAFTGRVVFIGYAKEKIAFDTQYFVKKELDIRGSRNAMPADFKAVMEYLKQGTCPVEELISGVYAPEEAQKALDKWADNPGEVFRILIKF